MNNFTLFEGITVVWLGAIVAGLGLTIHGLYLAFSASIIFGFVALLVEPSPLVFSLIYLGWGKDLPQIIVQWLSS